MVSSTTWKKFAIGLAGLSIGASIWCVSAGAQNQKAPDIVVTLLGTGSPIPEPGRVAPALPHDRMNAMTLVRAGQEVLLFDVGRGVSSGCRKPASKDEKSPPSFSLTSIPTTSSDYQTFG
jgi:hypothetical protein